MLYSTVKAVVTGAAEDARVVVERNGKIEVNDPSDITEEYLVEVFRIIPHSILKLPLFFFFYSPCILLWKSRKALHAQSDQAKVALG